MQIPNCYDPVCQAERREKAWDDYTNKLKKCVLCGEYIHPGTKFHTAHCQSVCTICKEELDDNVDIAEVE